MKTIEISNLNFFYDKKHILKDINLSVNKGEICGILGINGSGKSTLFKCILNLLKPKSGKITIGGKTPQKLGIKGIAKKISYVAQHENINFNFSVFEIVAMGISPTFGGIFGFKKSENELIINALKKVRMNKFLHENFNCLSGGQKQLVLIARAILQNTPILIFDEPTSALDFKNQYQIWQIILGLKNEGKTILICTHEPNHILWFCDKVAVFKDHTIRTLGRPSEIFEAKFLKEIYDFDFGVLKNIDLNCKNNSIIYPHLDNIFFTNN